MKSYICTRAHNSALSALGTGLSLAAAFMVTSVTPACMAQDTSGQASVRTAAIDAAAIPGGMGSISRVAAEGKTLHVTVGHSIFVDTKTRLRRVYVADPSVLNSVTLTPNEIIVTAMAPGVSSLTLLDESGQAQSYVVSSDLDIDGLRLAMTQAMRGDAVKVDGIGGRVTLSGTVATQAIADDAVKLAGLYSKDVGNALTVVPTHPKQVRLEVRILEVDRSKLLQMGINLFNPGGNTNFLAATTTSQYPSTAVLSAAAAGGSAIGTLTTSSPLNFMLYSAKLNLGTTIQDLQSKSVLQILAEPTITTISGVKAEFLSGGEFPFPMVQPGSGGTAPLVTITFRPYGVKLEFTPIVNEDGTIRLKVAPEVSALDYANAVSISGFTVPALSTRRADTEVELRSNQSFAISGLLDQRTTDILNKTPGAASIPILGYLFKSKNVNHATTELIVVVTPTVVDPLTETTEPVEPILPIHTLDTGDFDKSLGKNLNPHPAPPPIIPNGPVFGGTAPASAPAPAAGPTASAVQESAPAQTSQRTDAPTPVNPTTAPVAAVTVPTVAAPSKPTGNEAATSKASISAIASSTGGSSAEPASSRAGQVVEVMALSHESDAEIMVTALNRHGYDVAVHHDTQNSLYHLDVGPFTNTKDAELMRQRLQLDGYNATIK